MYDFIKLQLTIKWTKFNVRYTHFVDQENGCRCVLLSCTANMRDTLTYVVFFIANCFKHMHNCSLTARVLFGFAVGIYRHFRRAFNVHARVYHTLTHKPYATTIVPECIWNNDPLLMFVLHLVKFEYWRVYSVVTTQFKNTALKASQLTTSTTTRTATNKYNDGIAFTKWATVCVIRAKRSMRYDCRVLCSHQQ